MNLFRMGLQLVLVIYIMGDVGEVDAQSTSLTYACSEYPGVLYYCSSSCYPNCQDQFESYYNVMMILPNKAECYLNKDEYGAFRVFLPTTGIITAEADNYFLFNNECNLNTTGDSTPVKQGQVYDGYF